MTNPPEISSLRNSKILQAVTRLSQRRKEGIYLVGGAIRDLLLGRPVGKDFDFVGSGDVSGLAKAVAQELGGHAFPLDESFGTWRVVLKKAKKRAEVDFSSMQGKDIGEDLRQRDFTINSMAVGVKEIFHQEKPEFIDPLQGLSDLHQKTLRANSEESLRQDPLRMLRAFRFASTLGFSIEEETLKIIQKNRDLVIRSAWERIRGEFFAALNEARASHFLRELQRTGLLGVIFPEIEGWERIVLDASSNLSLLEHSFRTVEAGEWILIHPQEVCPVHAKFLDQHFSPMIEEGISRKALFKFLAFFHDSGKGKTGNSIQEDPFPRFLDHDQEGQKINAAIARRMKLSRRSTRIVSELTRQHLRLHSLTNVGEVTPRAKYRFFRDLGMEGIDLILLSISNALASHGLEFPWPSSALLANPLKRMGAVADELVRYYGEEYLKKPPPPLLDGREIIKALAIPQGKAVGDLLARLREAEILGKVQTKEEALKFLKNIDSSG